MYASDTFIEMSPPSNDPQFLANMSRAVLGAMQAADPQAVWVMQGWLFFNNPNFWQPPQAKALFDAVPHERMVVLDLFCEAAPVWNKTEAFHGKPWVWCIIHNFGGRVGLYGGLPQILSNLNAARTSPERGDLRGVGLIMEGFGYNPVVYDLLTDMIWRERRSETRRRGWRTLSIAAMGNVWIRRIRPGKCCGVRSISCPATRVPWSLLAPITAGEPADSV